MTMNSLVRVAYREAGRAAICEILYGPNVLKHATIDAEAGEGEVVTFSGLPLRALIWPSSPWMRTLPPRASAVSSFPLGLNLIQETLTGTADSTEFNVRFLHRLKTDRKDD